jgi:hypothetical protein
MGGSAASQNCSQQRHEQAPIHPLLGNPQATQSSVACRDYQQGTVWIEAVNECSKATFTGGF